MRHRLEMFASLVLLALGAVAHAQPVPCAECSRGDALIEHFSLQPLRRSAGELAGADLGARISSEQYARVIALRRRISASQRLGAVDDGDFSAIAASLCGQAAGPCVDATAQTMRCLADRCPVDLPAAGGARADLLELPPSCERYRRRKWSPPFGVGLDWGNGVQRSRYPSDGRAWSLGLELRSRLSNRVGVVARIDRVAGRDEATDADGDGEDDVYTGSITRISTLAGPSIVLLHRHFETTRRYLRLDVLGGLLSTPSQPDEDGLAAGFDLAYELSIIRIGLRLVHGFGDARDATMMIGHVGFVAGGGPIDNASKTCADGSATSSRFSLGFGWIGGGYGFPSELGYAATGLGIEAAWYLSRRFDALVRADLIVFPGDERERAIHQAVLGGVRIDHMKLGRWAGAGFFSAVMAGYSHGAVISPSTAGTGPVADVSVGWGTLGAEGSAFARLHGRFGISGDNVDYRVIFLSFGTELHFDSTRWRRRRK